jgi:hypothetical protein
LNIFIELEKSCNMFYGVTVLEGEAKSVCLLDLPSDTGNITKVVVVRSVL